MQKIKYLKDQKGKLNKDGTRTFYIEVPLYVQSELPDYRSKGFGSLEEARAYSLEIQAAFSRTKSYTKRQLSLRDDTVLGLVNYYYGTETFYNLSANSKRSYKMHIEQVINLVLPGYNMRFGDLSAAKVNRAHVNDIINLCRENISHHRALHTIKVLRVIWSVAVRDQKLRFNPFRDPKIKSIPPRKVIWDDAQVETFVAHCDDMGWHSLGSMALLCYQMCQRPGDIRQLKWKHLIEGTFVFEQEKTGTKVEVPVLPHILDRIKLYKHPTSDYVLVCETNDLPYDRWWYAKLTRIIREKAGLPSTLRMADLRRTGATKLASHSATEDEIMSVTGHKSREIVSTYVKHSKDIAKNAIMKAWT